jgi:putative flippase GtrA
MPHKIILNNMSNLFRYCIVGACGTLIDIVSLFLLREFIHIDLYVAVTISFVLAATSNFYFNKIWTFKDRSPRIFRQYALFMGISCIGLCLTLGGMWLFVSVLGIWYILSKLIVSGLVMIFNFLSNLLITFKGSRIASALKV